MVPIASSCIICTVVSLGTFGTASAARAHANQVNMSERFKINIHGITVFERNLVDGKFYAKACIPFASRRVRRNLMDCNITPLLRDAGAFWTTAFYGMSDTVLSEIERACQAVAPGSHLTAYGSCALESCLPGISDIDFIVEINTDGSVSEDYLCDVADFVRVRMRWPTTNRPLLSF
jgi:hypothetical protein